MVVKKRLWSQARFIWLGCTENHEQSFMGRKWELNSIRGKRHSVWGIQGEWRFYIRLAPLPIDRSSMLKLKNHFHPCLYTGPNFPSWYWDSFIKPEAMKVTDPKNRFLLASSQPIRQSQIKSTHWKWKWNWISLLPKFRLKSWYRWGKLSNQETYRQGRSDLEFWCTSYRHAAVTCAVTRRRKLPFADRHQRDDSLQCLLSTKLTRWCENITRMDGCKEHLALWFDSKLGLWTDRPTKQKELPNTMQADIIH